jgi:hypothetical protein
MQLLQVMLGIIMPEAQRVLAQAVAHPPSAAHAQSWTAMPNAIMPALLPVPQHVAHAWREPASAQDVPASLAVASLPASMVAASVVASVDASTTGVESPTQSMSMRLASAMFTKSRIGAAYHEVGTARLRAPRRMPLEVQVKARAQAWAVSASQPINITTRSRRLGR